MGGRAIRSDSQALGREKRGGRGALTAQVIDVGNAGGGGGNVTHHISRFHRKGVCRSSHGGMELKIGIGGGRLRPQVLIGEGHGRTW